MTDPMNPPATPDEIRPDAETETETESEPAPRPGTGPESSASETDAVPTPTAAEAQVEAEAEPAAVVVEESAPDGGSLVAEAESEAGKDKAKPKTASKAKAKAKPKTARKTASKRARDDEDDEPAAPPLTRAEAILAEDAAAAAAAAALAPMDDARGPELVWYVLKVQSSREDSIRDTLEKRVKIQGLEDYFGEIIVPTETYTDIRNGKKVVKKRKTYPGYIIVRMELNEKTWFTIRETPGVGDFVGAHGTPTKMTQAEVDQILGTKTAAPGPDAAAATAAEPAPPPKIDLEKGDRVKVKDGPFENFEGVVEEVVPARGVIKVMLVIFNRPTPVDLEYWQVERI